MCKLKQREARTFIVIVAMLTALLVVCGFITPGKAFAVEDLIDDSAAQIVRAEVQEELSGANTSNVSQAVKQSTGDAVTQTSEMKAANRSDEPDSAASSQTQSSSPSNSGLSEGLNADQEGDEDSEPSIEPTQPVDSPKLTGFVIVSGNTKVGTTLVAGVEGAPEGVSLVYQWYRGDSPIAGATTNVYTTAIADNGKDITCRVSASGYEGVLVSGAIRPLSSSQNITVEYWGYTDASPETQVLLKTEFANLTDIFDYKYDQNFDSDKTNDRVAYKLLGWQAEGWSDYYDVTIPENEFSTTLQDIAALAGWSNNAPLVFHAVQEVRQITVYYWGAGYEEDHDLEPVKVMSWFDVPYLEGIEWKGFLFDSQTEDWGYELDNSMTCGYILTELTQEPWSDELNVYLNWIMLFYQINFISPNGFTESALFVYEEEIELRSGLLVHYPGHEFVGWFTEPDGAGMQVHNGMKYCDIEPNDKLEGTNLYAFFTQLDLTGSVQISGGTNVGDTLTATVSGAPTDAQLQYQWYRGNNLIEGATGATYILVGDDAGAEIMCDVRDSGYKGILSSNAVGPIAGAETQAFAVFSTTDNSLNFYRRSALPTVGEMFSNRYVTAVYTGFEDSAIGPWKEYSSVIMNVSVVDKGIQPAKVQYWFKDFANCVFMDLSKLDTSKVTNMNKLFSGCSSLVNLDISGFSTSQVTNMAGMFLGCSKLISIDLSHFDIAKVTSMTRMFQDCSSLVNLVLPTSGTPRMNVLVGMFQNCSSLVVLDLSGINTAKTTNASWMFEGCASLITIYAASDADWSGISTSDGMFNGCINLVGGNGTEFDPDSVDASRACIDGLNGKSGYFTAKNAYASRNETVADASQLKSEC